MTHRWFAIVVAVSLVGLVSSECVAQQGRGGGSRCSGGGGGTSMTGGMNTGGGGPRHCQGGGYNQGTDYYNPAMQEAYRNYLQQRAASEAAKTQEKKQEREQRLETVQARRLAELAKREQRRRRIAAQYEGTTRTSSNSYTTR